MPSSAAGRINTPAGYNGHVGTKVLEFVRHFFSGPTASWRHGAPGLAPVASNPPPFASRN